MDQTQANGTSLDRHHGEHAWTGWAKGPVPMMYDSIANHKRQQKISSPSKTSMEGRKAEGNIKSFLKFLPTY